MKADAYAFLDLFIGLALLFSPLFPGSYEFLGFASEVYVGYLFILLIMTRGLIFFIPIIILAVIADRLKNVFLSSTSAVLMRAMFTMVISYIEGMMLALVTFPISLPLCYALSQINRERLTEIAWSMFGQGDPQNSFNIFVICLFSTAFSYISLFLFRTFGFSLAVRVLPQQSRTYYEHTLSMIRGGKGEGATEPI